MPGVLENDIAIPAQQAASVQNRPNVPFPSQFVRLPSAMAASAISNVASPAVLPLQPDVDDLIVWYHHVSNRPAGAHYAFSFGEAFEKRFSVVAEKREELLEALGEAWEEYRDGDWDGYGALQVSEQTFSHARRFVEAFPPNLPNPTIGADPDGHLSFEWYRSPRCILTVSVSPEGDLHYSALREVFSGHESKLSKSYGTEPFLSEIPDPILRLVSQVMGA